MKYKHNLLKLLILFFSIATNMTLTSCSKLSKNSKQETNNSNPKRYYITNKKAAQADSDVTAQLLACARSIEKSLATLAATQEINNIPVLNTAPLITPEGGMGGIADIDWTGPIEPLLEKIANMTNYNLKIMGSPTPIPIIVSITQSKAIVADILKNASLQAGKRANVVVFPANKVIELRYKFGAYNTNPPSTTTQTSNINHE